MNIGRYEVHARFEWKLQDLWIGAYWNQIGTAWDLWICVLPCLPLHIDWWPIKERDPFAAATFPTGGPAKPLTSDGAK